jgi:hypothetical protein
VLAQCANTAHVLARWPLQHSRPSPTAVLDQVSPEINNYKSLHEALCSENVQIGPRRQPLSFYAPVSAHHLARNLVFISLSFGQSRMEKFDKFVLVKCYGNVEDSLSFILCCHIHFCCQISRKQRVSGSQDVFQKIA